MITHSIVPEEGNRRKYDIRYRDVVRADAQFL